MTAWELEENLQFFLKSLDQNNLDSIFWVLSQTGTMKEHRD